MLALADEKFWELKEAAKWSLDVSERKRAIRQLATLYGTEAIKSIAEIREVAAYDAIRAACIDAIRQVGRRSSAKTGSAKRGRKTRRTRQKTKAKKRPNSQ
jgi:hypothetical protein